MSVLPCCHSARHRVFKNKWCAKSCGVEDKYDFLSVGPMFLGQKSRYKDKNAYVCIK
jgi:hypothetical protein